MNVFDFLVTLENTSIGVAVRGGDGWDWLFPNVETLHVLSLAVVFGSIFTLDLRLIGAISRTSAVTALSAELLPYTWVAFACAAITGTLMFVSKASLYFYNTPFRFKFLCMLLAAVNMGVFHGGAYRRVIQWENSLPPPPAARLAGSTSIALWMGVIFFGRWIGFTI